MKRLVPINANHITQIPIEINTCIRIFFQLLDIRYWSMHDDAIEFTVKGTVQTFLIEAYLDTFSKFQMSRICTK